MRRCIDPGLELASAARCEREYYKRDAVLWSPAIAIQGIFSLSFAERYGKGATIPELAAEYEVGVGTIWRALRPEAKAKHLGEMSVQHEPQRRVDLVLGSAILAILSLPAIVFIGWMIVQSV